MGTTNEIGFPSFFGGANSHSSIAVSTASAKSLWFASVTSQSLSSPSWCSSRSMSTRPLEYPAFLRFSGKSGCRTTWISRSTSSLVRFASYVYSPCSSFPMVGRTRHQRNNSSVIALFMTQLFKLLLHIYLFQHEGEFRTFCLNGNHNLSDFRGPGWVPLNRLSTK